MDTLFIIASLSLLLTVSGFEPPRKPCEKTQQLSELISVNSYDAANATLWRAKPGKPMKVDFNFVAKEDLNKIETAIYAILDPKGGPGGKPLEISYEKPFDACPFINSTTCVTEGIKKGQTYTLSVSFDVPPTVPKISLEVRFVVRQNMDSKRLNRSQKANWSKHPGKIVLCYRLPVQVV